MFLTGAQLNLQSGDDIDALAYNQSSGALIFSLTDASPTNLELGNEPLYAVRVTHPGGTPTVSGPPTALLAPGGERLSELIGRRVRGVCKIDPLLLTPREK